MSRFGGGTTIDAVVRTPVALPGRPVDGVVEIVAGEFEQEISYVEMAEVEVVFLAGPHATDVLLVGDRKAGGFFDGGGDTTQRFTVRHDALGHDWESELQGRLAELGRRRGLFG